MDPERVVDNARKSISKFCIEECRSYCCRKGYLTFGPESLKIISQGKDLDLKFLKGKCSLYLGNGCPSLKDFKCLIHDHPKRPLACKQFPIFLEGKIIRLSPRCLAVKNNLLYPFIKQLLSMGYKLGDVNPFADLEFS